MSSSGSGSRLKLGEVVEHGLGVSFVMRAVKIVTGSSASSTRTSGN